MGYVSVYIYELGKLFIYKLTLDRPPMMLISSAGR